MRNIFRRQTEATAPTLRERAATLREGLSHHGAAPGERADLYDRLLAAYAEDRAARPITGSDGDEIARRAANLVLNRTWALAREIVSMPPPATLDGLRATALASAILCEAEGTMEDPTTVAAIGLTRAALSITGTPLPPGFGGFGDEPDFKERDRALFNRPGSLPAWAIAEIEAEDAADDMQEATAEAHNDLPTAILDGWAAWGATNGRLGHEGTDEEYDAALAPMNRLAKLAEDLPATVENIPAKALACAWMEWVSSERPGQPRDAYGRADRLVYDLHAAIMASGPRGAVSSPILRPEPDLVGMVDLSAASISNLRALHDMADEMASVVYAMAVSGRGCNGWPAQGRLYSIEFTPAGKLMQQIAEALVEVEAAAYREITKRTPTSRYDQETRLQVIARGVIANDDKAETAAFARELLAMVEQ